MLTHSTPKFLPFAGELEGALVRRDGGEPFALDWALVTQPVGQTQGFTH